MGWESSGVVGFDLGPLLHGQTRIAKVETAYQTCKQSNRSNRKVIDWSQLRCNSNRLKFFKCNSNSNRLKFYLLHLLLSIIFLLQFTLCYFSEGGCRKMITKHGL